MKKRIMLLTSMNFVITLFGCNGNSDKTEDSLVKRSKENIQEVASNSTECYILENSKDTVSLKMEITNKLVSGDLLYQYFEKDRNNGTIAGKMKGDTIFATYTFISEGIESKREVVFLKKGNELIEGYTRINNAVGEPDFSNHSTIKFDEKLVLQKTDCQ